MALLEIQEVSSGYGEVQILWDVSLELERGKLTALVGSNGAGKTTLLRTVMGLLKPSQGSITFDGRDVTRISPHGKAAQGLVLVPEGRQLFPSMTVYENLELSGEPGKGLRHAPPLKGASRPEGRYSLRRGAADVGRGPRAHGPT